MSQNLIIIIITNNFNTFHWSKCFRFLFLYLLNFIIKYVPFNSIGDGTWFVFVSILFLFLNSFF